MLVRRPSTHFGTAAAVSCIFSCLLHGQGVTTGSITGTVTDSGGAPIEAAQVQIVNQSTGVTQGGLTRDNGHYAVQGLEVGGPYTVTVRRVGFIPQTHTGLRVVLGQGTRADFQLARQSVTLSGVTIQGRNDPVITPTKTGTSTTISDSALHRLPTLSRNFTDFITLVPQVNTTTSYISGGGVNIRQNVIQIDGALASDIFGIGATGQPGSQANAKSIPLDAVKEYQVLLAPFDIRQGNFGGLLLNAVTKSGTNEFHGTAYGYTRNDNMERQQNYLNNFSQQQYGFSLGGPIVRNRVFFYVNSEFQKLQTPATGPYIGSSDNYVSQTSIGQFSSLLKGYGLADPGTGEQLQKQNPTSNVFARIDAYLPWNTHLVVRHNYAYADNTSFSRGAGTSSNPNFYLTSNSYKFSSKTNASVVELLSNMPNGMFNELLLTLTKTSDFRTIPVRFPQITVRGIPRTDATTGTANFVAGTEASSQGNSLDQRTFEVIENFTFPVGTHSITFGTKDQFYRPVNLFGQNSLGSWTFADLTSFQNGTPTSYTVSAPSPTDPNKGLSTFHASQSALYMQDVWQATSRLSLTGGLRWDRPHFGDRPPFNQSVLNEYQRNTSDVPSRALISPRIAFNWDVTGDQRNQLRGGMGYFAGSVPFVYLSNAFGNSGLSGYGSLTCSGSTSGSVSLLPPAFNAANIATPPTSCLPSGVKPGGTIALSSSVNTIDPNFHFPQYVKYSLAYDHRFESGMVGTLEGLYTRSKYNTFYRNLALAGPQGLDRNGRVLYGTLTATGGTPKTVGSRTQVLDLTNSSGDYIYSLTGTLQRSFSDRMEGSLSYTYQQARDVTGTTSSTAGSNYRYQRDVSGDIDNHLVTRSKNDQPHRIVMTGTYRMPTKTDISFIYTGNSGAPFDYVYGAGTGTGSGDLNADGNSQNDLVYVPKDTRDTTEILFTGFNGTPAQRASAAAQAAAFDAFINNVPCLRNNRGHFVTRNSCHNPWENDVDVSIAQSLSMFRSGQNMALRLDIFNFGNLINPRWGRQRFSDQNATCGPICSATVLLTQTGSVLPAGVTSSAYRQGVFTFDTSLKPYTALNASSNYRMQLSLRYSF